MTVLLAWLYNKAMSSNVLNSLRTLALCGLLCLVGLQVLELSHSHGVDESVAQCQLCSSTADTAALVSTIAFPSLALVFCFYSSRVLSQQSASILAFYSRGPPRNS